MKKLLFAFLFLSYGLPTVASVQLAKPLKQLEYPISEYLVSEKLDGVRAIWNGKQLKTRQGNVIFAPAWFTQGWPNRWLDGELYSAKGEFEFISATVRDKSPNQLDWRKIRFAVFDIPDVKLPFSARVKAYKKLIQDINTPTLTYVEQYRFDTKDQLTRFFNDIVAHGGEGVMLHLASAEHQAGRSNNLLKMKPVFEGRAKVVEIVPGKGKHLGRMGAVWIKTENGVLFKLGSGFSDLQRASPPQVGSWLRFQYNGYTKNGIPRFARFIEKASAP